MLMQHSPREWRDSARIVILMLCKSVYIYGKKICSLIDYDFYRHIYVIFSHKIETSLAKTLSVIRFQMDKWF